MKSISVPKECWGETEGRRGATAHTLQSGDSHYRAAVLMIVTFTYLQYCVHDVQSSFLWAVPGLISALAPRTTRKLRLLVWTNEWVTFCMAQRSQNKKGTLRAIKVQSLSVSLQKQCLGLVKRTRILRVVKKTIIWLRGDYKRNPITEYSRFQLSYIGIVFFGVIAQQPLPPPFEKNIYSHNTGLVV